MTVLNPLSSICKSKAFYVYKELSLTASGCSILTTCHGKSITTIFLIIGILEFLNRGNY